MFLDLFFFFGFEIFFVSTLVYMYILAVLDVFWSEIQCIYNIIYCIDISNIPIIQISDQVKTVQNYPILSIMKGICGIYDT